MQNVFSSPLSHLPGPPHQATLLVLLNVAFSFVRRILCQEFLLLKLLRAAISGDRWRGGSWDILHSYLFHILELAYEILKELSSWPEI